MFKWLGLICIVAASSGVGFGYARSIRRQSAQLGHLIDSLGYMRSEILYRMTPLPELFETLSGAENNAVGLFFSLCASQLRSDRTMSRRSTSISAGSRFRRIPKNKSF